jgi:hypothetical protein
MSKLYVITRNDMDFVYQGVQLGHGVGSFMVAHPDHPWKNHTLVYLEVDDLKELERWVQKLQMRGHVFTTFYEPDIGDKLTAIACHTDSNIFSRLRMWGDKQREISKVAA